MTVLSDHAHLERSSEIPFANDQPDAPCAHCACAGGCASSRAQSTPQRGVQRGIFLRAMGGAVSALALTGAVGALGRLASPMRALADAARSSTLAKTAGTYIGNIKRMKAHQALGYTDPATGDPAVLLKLGSGKIIALDAVCKHQGCTVMFDPSQDLMICPCHGSTYDPNHGAKVIAGPAPAPLDILKIKILPNWDVYALDGKGGKASKANGLHKVKTW